MTPPRTLFAAPLYVILTVSRTCYVYIYVYGKIPVQLQLRRYFHKHIAALRARPYYPQPWAPSLASAVFLVTGLDFIWLMIFDLIRLSCGFDLIILNFINSIWLMFNVLILTRVTQVKSHSSQAAGGPTLARLSSKYSNTEIVEYFTILIIKIGFGEEHSNRILKRLLRSKHQYIFRI